MPTESIHITSHQHDALVALNPELILAAHRDCSIRGNQQRGTDPIQHFIGGTTYLDLPVALARKIKQALAGQPARPLIAKAKGAK